MRTLLALLTLGLATVAGPAFAEIYRYADANGTEHFVMKIEEVPEAYRAQALERAKQASSRFNVVGPTPRASQPRPRASARRATSRSSQTAPSGGSEHYWRKQFTAQHRAISKAAGELERAEAADRTTRAGHSSSAAGARARWGRNALREEKADRRIERAEAALAAAEDAMHKLRQRASGKGVPVEWMR